LKEEHKLRVFENRVLRRIFRPKRDETIGGWRKLHNEELHNVYYSPNIITSRIIKPRRRRWAGHLARKKENRNAYKILVGEPEAKRPLGKRRRRWKDNVVVWTGLIWLRTRKTGELLRIR
jgi:hypothetical protein